MEFICPCVVLRSGTEITYARSTFNQTQQESEKQKQIQTTSIWCYSKQTVRWNGMGMILANEKLGCQRNGLDKKKLVGRGRGVHRQLKKKLDGGQGKGPGNQYFRV